MDILCNDVFSPAWGIPLPEGWKTSTRKKTNKLRNMRTWNNVFNKNVNTALSRFNLIGLPDTVDERVMLMSDLWYGRTLVFRHKGNIYALPCVNTGAGWTVYGYWKKANWIALNGMSGETTVLVPGDTRFLQETPAPEILNGIDDIGVVIRSSPTCYPFITTVIQYTDYMADALRTLDIARRTLKHPIIIAAPQSALKSVSGGQLEIDDNQDVIVTSGLSSTNELTTLQLAPSGITEEIKELYEWYESEFLGCCGIQHNAQTDKKGENLLNDEVTIDDEYDVQTLDVELKQKNYDTDFCNKVLGTKIKWETTKKDIVKEDPNVDDEFPEANQNAE